jgi:branched-chain amino acid aminotransferase
MNVFFIIGNKAITPSLDEGTILDGVTRSTVIAILIELGFTIEERKINIDEVIDAYKQKKLAEVFGTGTAATISPIKELKYRDFVMHFDTTAWKTTPQIKKTLAEIREGKREDKHNWLFKV